MKKNIFFGMALSVAIAGQVRAAPQSFTVTAVRVLKDGQWRADPNGTQTVDQCRRFRLASAAARQWFKRAHEVGKQEWLEQLDWTQCSASGTLTTGDRKTYSWELDQSGRARVVVSPNVSVYLGGKELPFTGGRRQ